MDDSLRKNVDRAIKAAIGNGQALGEQSSLSSPNLPVDSELELGWARVDASGLVDWISTNLRSSPPPIYRLGHKKTTEGLPDFRDYDAQLSWQPDRQVPEVRMTVPVGALPSEGFLQATASAALSLDQDRRLVVAPRSGEGETVYMDIATELYDQKLPIIGPGGRVTVYKSSTHIQADLVVRLREKKLQSFWRTPAMIYESLHSSLLAGGPMEDIVNIFATVGYLELSKYETQHWLRPTFLFVVERMIDVGETHIEWQGTLAEAATINEDVPIRAGLGSWA